MEPINEPLSPSKIDSISQSTANGISTQKSKTTQVTPEAFLKEFHSMLKYRKVPESFITKTQVLYAKVAGSTGYNLNFPDSDDDYICIFQGTFGTRQKKRNPNAPLRGSSLHTREGAETDLMAWEIDKMVEIGIHGSIHFIELLYTPLDSPLIIIQHSFWKKILQFRKQFLSVKTAHDYVGFGKKNNLHVIQRFEKDNYNRKQGIKKLYQSFRLFYEATRILQGMEPIVYFPDDHYYRKFLMRLRSLKYKTNEETIPLFIEPEHEEISSFRKFPTITKKMVTWTEWFAFVTNYLEETAALIVSKYETVKIPKENNVESLKEYAISARLALS